jgi:hypothetical protein
MLALKLQRLTTRTLIRPSQLRFVPSSTIIIRTYKHGWRRINNPEQHRKLPPMVPSVRHARSPRVRSHEQKISNYKDFEKETPKEEFILIKVFVLFVGLWIIEGIFDTGAQILIHSKGVRGFIWLVQYMWENDERIPGELMDVRGVIEEENAMWLDQYMRENQRTVNSCDEGSIY